MHGDVEKEGLYQNCKFGDPRGRVSFPRAGPNLVHSLYGTNREFSIIIVNFVTLGIGVLVLGWGQNGH